MSEQKSFNHWKTSYQNYGVGPGPVLSRPAGALPSVLPISNPLRGGYAKNIPQGIQSVGRWEDPNYVRSMALKNQPKVHHEPSATDVPADIMLRPNWVGASREDLAKPILPHPPVAGVGAGYVKNITAQPSTQPVLPPDQRIHHHTLERNKKQDPVIRGENGGKGPARHSTTFSASFNGVQPEGPCMGSLAKPPPGGLAAGYTVNILPKTRSDTPPEEYQPLPARSQLLYPFVPFETQVKTSMQKTSFAWPPMQQHPLSDEPEIQVKLTPCPAYSFGRAEPEKYMKSDRPWAPPTVHPLIMSTMRVTDPTEFRYKTDPRERGAPLYKATFTKIPEVKVEQAIDFQINTNKTGYCSLGSPGILSENANEKMRSIAQDSYDLKPLCGPLSKRALTQKPKASGFCRPCQSMPSSSTSLVTNNFTSGSYFDQQVRKKNSYAYELRPITDRRFNALNISCQ